MAATATAGRSSASAAACVTHIAYVACIIAYIAYIAYIAGIHRTSRVHRIHRMRTQVFSLGCRLLALKGHELVVEDAIAPLIKELLTRCVEAKVPEPPYIVMAHIVMAHIVMALRSRPWPM